MSSRNFTAVLLLSTVLLLVATATSVNGAQFRESELELVKLIAINRHGHRAPNAPYWKLCPNDIANKLAFGVRPEGLTSLGIKEELAFGTYLRKTYGTFIGRRYDEKKHWFSAVGEPRTLQSVESTAKTLFPDGHGPAGFLPSRPQIVPVFSDRQFDEFLLNDAPCWGRTAVDVQNWLRNVGNPLSETPEVQATLTKLLNLCGTPAEVRGRRSVDNIIKIIVDGVVFAHDFGIKSLNGKIDPKLFFTLRNLSNTYLMGKLYGTDAQRTYVAGNMPEFLVESLKYVESNGTHRLPTTFTDDYEGVAIRERRLNVFCVHREMMYGLAFFFGWEYAVDKMGPGELPAGSSVMLELHRNRVDGSLWVKTYLWTPYTPTYELKIPECGNAPYCSVAEFASAYETRIRRTGTWERLCAAK